MAKVTGIRSYPAHAGGTRVVEVERLTQGLSHWVQQYLAVEAASGAANTYRAKKRDLDGFLAFFQDRLRSDSPEDWTKSVTTAYLRSLENGEKKRKPATVNRKLASLRHCAAWIHDRRPFLAGNPCRGLRELTMDEPAWKGLTELEVMRLRAAVEQLAQLKSRRNQHGLRDQAIFLVLLHSGMRVSELLSLHKTQYTGRHFVDVRRKGNVRSSKVYVATEARDAIDAYVEHGRERDSAWLFCVSVGNGLGTAACGPVTQTDCLARERQIAQGGMHSSFGPCPSPHDTAPGR
jgi:integrase/recombinase XerD